MFIALGSVALEVLPSRLGGPPIVWLCAQNKCISHQAQAFKG